LHGQERAKDAGFRQEWRQVKRANKERLAGTVAAQQGLEPNLDSLFDCQVKRIHEYKR